MKKSIWLLIIVLTFSLALPAQRIDFFSGLFGYKYPWAKYDQVTTPRQGGGAEATSELLKFREKSEAVKGLKESAVKDEFWAVRKSVVETLGKINSIEHTGLFQDICRDNNSKVRTAALKALGDYKDPGLVVFFRKRFKEDNSYLAQAEALRSIGKCGDRSQLSFLQEAAGMTSPRDVIKRAAAWARENIKQRN